MITLDIWIAEKLKWLNHLSHNEDNLLSGMFVRTNLDKYILTHPFLKLFIYKALSSAPYKIIFFISFSKYWYKYSLLKYVLFESLNQNPLMHCNLLHYCKHFCKYD